MDMIRGQKVKIADITANSTQLTVELQLNAAFTIDFSCFGVDAAGKLSDERYMTFFNQPQSPLALNYLIINLIKPLFS